MFKGGGGHIKSFLMNPCPLLQDRSVHFWWTTFLSIYFGQETKRLLNIKQTIIIQWPFYVTSVSARWRVPFAVEENLRGMNERMTEWKSLGLFTIRFGWGYWTIKVRKIFMGESKRVCVREREKFLYQYLHQYFDTSCPSSQLVFGRYTVLFCCNLLLLIATFIAPFIKTKTRTTTTNFGFGKWGACLRSIPF